MNDLPFLILAIFVGLGAGFIFFGGLWLTTRNLAEMKHPALWLPLSFIIRTAIVLSAIYWVGKDHFPRMAIALLGFVISRIIVIYLTGVKEAGNAS